MPQLVIRDNDNNKMIVKCASAKHMDAEEPHSGIGGINSSRVDILWCSLRLQIVEHRNLPRNHLQSQR